MNNNESGIVELFWDCPECGQKHLSAVFDKRCSNINCLTWKDTNVPVYDDPSSPIITDPEQLKAAERPPSWICKHCNAENPDEGLPANLLQCGNCDLYQIVVDDEKSPERVTLDEIVARIGNYSDSHHLEEDNCQNRRNACSQQNLVTLDELVTQIENYSEHSHSEQDNHLSTHEHCIIPQLNRVTSEEIATIGKHDTENNHLEQSNCENTDNNDKSNSPRQKIGIATLGLGLAGLTSVGLVYTSQSDNLKIDVDNLTWQTQVELQEYQPKIAENWINNIPAKAEIIDRNKRQSGYVNVKIGTETRYRAERYQSGTETKYRSERYQSGTRSETYTEYERRQTGTKQKCKTVSKGNGYGKRKCTSVPTYSRVSVKKTRRVPVYSTRQVPDRVPVYSTRQVPYEVPAYSTRQVPYQAPVYKQQPTYDIWVKYRVYSWSTISHLAKNGIDDELKAFPNPKLSKNPQQRLINQTTICKLTGSYQQKRAIVKDTWTIPCQEFDRLDIGDKAVINPDTDSFQLIKAID